MVYPVGGEREREEKVKWEGRRVGEGGREGGRKREREGGREGERESIPVSKQGL